MVRNWLLIFITAGITFFACNSNTPSLPATSEPAPVTASGEQLFKINCAQCHRPAEDFTGPALKNVAARWKNKALLYEFIKEPQAVIAKDPYAKALFLQWKQAYMQPFPNLSDDDIDQILNYCNTAR